MAIDPIRSPLFERVQHIQHGFYDATQPAPSPMGQIHQVHGTDIKTYTGHEQLNAVDRPKADGSMTSVQDLWVAVQTADCIPALMTSVLKPAVGAVHAGWRGVLNGILPKAITAFENTGVRGRDLLVALGPSIGPCCFEVGQDVIDDFEKQWGWMWASRPKEKPWRKGRKGLVNEELLNSPLNPYALTKTNSSDLWLDLKAIAKMQLVNSGVLEPSVDPISLCTYCGTLRLQGEEFRAESNDWASYRRSIHEGFTAARQWSSIRLLTPETELALKNTNPVS